MPKTSSKPAAKPGRPRKAKPDQEEAAPKATKASLKPVAQPTVAMVPIKHQKFANDLLALAVKTAGVEPHDGDIPAYLPSGNWLLDTAISFGAGWPYTKFIHLMGQEQSGKTTILMLAAKQILAEGGQVYWFDQEDGWSWRTANLHGLYKHPNFHLFPPMLAEKAFRTMRLILKKLSEAGLKGEHIPTLLAYDSLGGSLTLDVENKAEEEAVKIGAMQKLTKNFCARTVPYMVNTRAIVAFTNHTYVDITTYTGNAPKKHVPTGGKAIPYRSFLELEMKAGPVETNSSGKQIYGTIEVKIRKNKGGNKNLKFTLPIFFKAKHNIAHGIDDAYTCFHYLVSQKVWEAKDKKIVTNYDPDGKGNMSDTMNNLWSNYHSDENFRTFVRNMVETTFYKKNGIA